MASIDFTQLPEAQQVAFYGVLIAMAHVDEHLDPEELNRILEAMDLEDLSEAGRAEVKEHMLHPPALEDVLAILAEGPKELRFGCVIHLTDVILADEDYAFREKLAMRQVRDALGVSRDQALAIEQFVGEVHALREQGLEGDELEQRIKTAASGLTGVGVPAAALYFSGSFVGLGVKGVVGSLVALKVALVPGVGIAVLLGAAGVMAARWVSDRARRRRALVESTGRAERSRRNLQALITELEVHAVRAEGALAEKISRKLERLRALVDEDR